ncbi:MAG: hypothetical protein HG454_005725 [Clostridiales bacterium]|nr:hypothetical protein [Clostridiales bacterium]
MTKGVNLYEVKDHERELIAILKKELKEKEIKYWIESETISSIALNEKALFEQYIKAIHEFADFVIKDKEVCEFKYRKWNIEKENNKEIVFWAQKKYKKDSGYHKVMIVIIELRELLLRHKIFTRKKENVFN